MSPQDITVDDVLELQAVENPLDRASSKGSTTAADIAERIDAQRARRKKRSKSKCSSGQPASGRPASKSRSPLAASEVPGQGQCLPSSEGDVVAKKVERLKEGEVIFDRYQWREVLQEEGDGGKVVVCQEKGSSTSHGMNVMKLKAKSSFQLLKAQRRFTYLAQLLLNLPPHPGLVRTHKVLEDDKYFYTVMEYATGGTFLNGLLSEFPNGVIPADALRCFTRDILEAVCFLHSQGMLHRDLKPDNLVMKPVPGEGRSRVLLCDFDHAGLINPQTERVYFSYGTPRFQAPETFLGQSSKQSDLWSVGVIVYLLVTGKMPYPDDTFLNDVDCNRHSPRQWGKAVSQKLKQSQVDWDGDAWLSLPPCKSLCQSLMAFEASDRPPDAEAALSYDWFVSAEPSENFLA